MSRKIKLEWGGAETGRMPNQKNPEKEESGTGKQNEREPERADMRSQNGRKLEEVNGAAIMGGSQKDWRKPERQGAGLRGSRNGRKGMGRGSEMGGRRDGRES